jgi:hypothetical protein
MSVGVDVFGWRELDVEQPSPYPLPKGERTEDPCFSVDRGMGCVFCDIRKGIEDARGDYCDWR